MFARCGKNFYVEFLFAQFADVFVNAVTAGSVLVNVFKIMSEHGNFFDINVPFAIRAIIERSARFRAGRFFGSSRAVRGLRMRMRSEEDFLERGVFGSRKLKFYRSRSFGKFDKSVFVRFDLLIAYERGNLEFARLSLISHGKRALRNGDFFAYRACGRFFSSV